MESSEELLHRRGDADALFAEGILIFQFGGSESQRKIGMRRDLGPVKLVAKDRQIGMHQVNADLVGTAGQRCDLQESPVPGLLENLEVGLGLFAKPGVYFHPGRSACGRCDFGADSPIGLLGDAFDNGEVFLFHGAGLEQLGILRDGPLALAEEENPGRFSIEAMNETEEFQVTGLGPELATLDGGEDRELKVAAGPLPIIWRQKPPGRLVDGKNGPVFVKDGNGEGFS